jgi:hypothetical protein
VQRHARARERLAGGVHDSAHARQRDERHRQLRRCVERIDRPDLRDRVALRVDVEFAGKDGQLELGDSTGVIA